MNKLVCIVGATGTGKTAKAIKLSQEQSSILISADSRQVYRGMDIVTGKDHPHNINIVGIDIVNPDEPCSVAVWYDNVMPIIKQAWNKDKLPIIVGGTGLYIKSLTDGIDTIQVPINQNLRDQLIPLSVDELQVKLKKLDFSKYQTMNQSDVNNSRRLIRSIEVQSFYQNNKNHIIEQRLVYDSSLIGLKYSDEIVQHSQISQRVKSRLKLGAIEETERLLSKYDKSLQSMTAIGYKSIIEYLEGKCDKEQMVQNWADDEMRYSKRQMTWFRKQPVIWYDVDKLEES